MKHPLRHLIPALALATLLALPASGVAAAPPLQPYVAHYEVLRDGAPAGRATVSLNAEGEGQWRLHSRTEGTQGLAALAGLLVEETSVFSETAEGLQCISYRYRQSGLRVRERSVDCGSGDPDLVSRDQHFRVSAEEVVTLASGENHAWRVERIRDDNERSTTTWFDLEKRVPLRVVQRENGKSSFEMRLLSLETGTR